MKKTKKLFAVLLTVILTFSFSVQAFATTALPTVSAGKTITCYTLEASGKIYAYTAADLKKKTGGYIACSTDECQILKISGNAVQVKYPVKGGTRTAWFPRSAFTSYNISGGADSKWTQDTKITTYRRADGKNAFGYVAAGDVCYKLTAKGSYTQILYPLSSGGYKLGWVLTSQIKTKELITQPATSKEKAYLEKLNKMMNGSSYSGKYKIGIRYSGDYYSEQCKGFAKSIHEKLFGYTIGSTQSKPNNYLLNINTSKTRRVGSVTNMTESKVKALFMQARAGDFVQMRRSHTGSHSAIIVSVSSSGVTFLEANLDGKNTISKNTYTWARLCEKNAAMSLYTANNY